MSLCQMLSTRAAQGDPIRVGLIGTGKFGTMFLAQARTTPGIQVAAVCDMDPERAHTALALAQWPPMRAVARSLADALDNGGTWVAPGAMDLIEQPGLDLVIEASGDAAAGLRHAAAAIAAGIPVVMATIEADVLAGPLLAARAAEKGIVYSLASGDHAAQLCEMVDWARTTGFEVACAGKGARHLPAYHAATPDTVWDKYGIAADRAKAAGMNPRILTAMVDGTKSAIEMAAVANATGLAPPEDGLSFHPCGTHDLARLLKPRSEGGVLAAMGQVETISSLERDGRQVVGDLRWGTFVIVRPQGHFAAACLPEYGLLTDDTGTYAAMWRPHQMAGLELGMSVATVALRREPTGCPRAFAADVVAVAKRDLAAGDTLDGEGGFTVWGKLVPAPRSLDEGSLPIGLTRGIRMARPVRAGATLGWKDVILDERDDTVALRRAMEDRISFV